MKMEEKSELCYREVPIEQLEKPTLIEALKVAYERIKNFERRIQFIKNNRV